MGEALYEINRRSCNPNLPIFIKLDDRYTPQITKSAINIFMSYESIFSIDLSCLKIFSLNKLNYLRGHCNLLNSTLASTERPSDHDFWIRYYFG